jgi:hypothetical protein
MIRRSFAALAVCGAALSCGASPPPVVTANVATPAAPAPANPDRSAEWVRASLRSDGISALFPTKPKEGWFYSSDDEERFLETEGGDDAPYYELRRDRYFPATSSTTTEADVAKWLAGMVKQVERAESIKENGFTGRLLEGVDEKGRRLSARAYLAGNDTYLLVARAPSASFDRAAVDRFFASLEVRPPLRFYASVDGRFSLLVPPFAHESDMPPPAPGAVVRSFSMGPSGSLPTVFAASFTAGEGFKAMPVDVALQTVVLKMANTTDPTAIEKLGPIQIHGAPGREYTMKTRVSRSKSGPRDEFIRGRMLIVGDRVYMIIYTTVNEDELRSEQVTRILDSLRWPAPP